MHYTETTDIAKDYALSALKRMKELKIAANPRNYSIWYEYYAGKNSGLKKTLDDLIAASPEISDDAYNDVYERFILAGQLSNRERDWSDKIEIVANRLLESLSSTGRGAKEYGAALQTFSGDIAQTQDIAQIKSLVTGILEETREMGTRSRELERRVNESAAEIAELRLELENSRRDALTDGLTGIANRKCFDQTLYEAAMDAVDEGEPLSLILADIDHFKAFNDEHGHQLGDQVLRLVARTLIQCIKGKDTASRFGGEEFAIVLPQTTSGGATAVAENIRKTVAAKRIVRKGSEDSIGAITCSFGVSVYVPGEDLSEFIERVDKALYTAKKLGRNRVICEERRQTVAAE